MRGSADERERAGAQSRRTMLASPTATRRDRVRPRLAGASARGSIAAAVAAVSVAAGGVAYLAGATRVADAVWAVAIAALLLVLLADVARKLAHGRIGVDAVALVAMAGALALGQYLAGAVIALMLSGGNALEASAARRARRELGRSSSGHRRSPTSTAPAASRRFRSRRSRSGTSSRCEAARSFPSTVLSSHPRRSSTSRP